MYREPAVVDDAAPKPPSEFVYEARERRRGPGVALFEVLALPLIAFGVVTPFFGGVAGGAAGVVAGLITYRWWRPKPERTVLRVESGRLVVSIEGKKPNVFDVALADVENVELDTKTVQHTMEGDSAIPAMRAIETKRGLEIDEARIVLILADDRRVPLSDIRVPHTETSERFGKMRVFLRKHGWLPHDERERERE